MLSEVQKDLFHELPTLMHVKHVCTFPPSPECWRTLLPSVLTLFHRDFNLVKVSSSNWYMSLAAQQHPRWRVKVQLQSHLSQVSGSVHLTGKRWRDGGKQQQHQGKHAHEDLALPATYAQHPAESGWSWTGLPRDHREIAPPPGIREELQIAIK